MDFIGSMILIPERRTTTTHVAGGFIDPYEIQKNGPKISTPVFQQKTEE
jgi:hypothetical protein